MVVTRSVRDLSRGIEELLEQRFIGEIVIGQSENSINIYLSDRKLLWVKDQKHARRRWHRAIDRYNADSLSARDLVLLKEMDDFPRLSHAIARQQIKLSHVQGAIAEVATEILSELFTQQSFDQKITWTIHPNENLQSVANLALSPEQTKAILLKADISGKQWQASELGNYLPTLSPVIEQEEIYEAIEIPIPKSYLQGKHSLWDLSAKMNTSIILITRTLVNLERQNIIKFQQIPDIPETNNGRESFPLLATQPLAKNSNITFNEPQADSSKVMATPGTNTAKSGFDPRKPIIACIDDSPVLAHSVKKILASVGYQSMIIPEPMAGMGLLAKYRPNLILLDLMMPTVDGYSVCKFLRETNLFKTIPIVILTSKDTMVDRTRAKLAGATDFLRKPPEPQELLQVVRLHLRDVPWN